MTMKNVEDIYPLSPMQQGMLFHTLYAPDSGVYFEQLSWIIRGDLNIFAFEQAWQQLVDRYAILRTIFIWEGLPEPLQVVRQKVTLSWQHYDLRNISPAHQELQVGSFLEIDRARGFELGRAPLMRQQLVHLADRTYQFIWSFHHILLDGWSTAILLKELFIFYAGWCQGQRLQLANSPLYRNYIAWLQSRNIVQAEEFWREHLKGFTEPTLLPMSRARTDREDTQITYRRQQIFLSEETTATLYTLARQHQLTVNTILQGAWAFLLSRYSGEEDIIFGVTSSGRPTDLMSVEEMVGLFINTLPMRVHLSPHDTLLSWLKALQMQQLRVRQYEYSPLVQIQGWSEVPVGQALFESIMVFENYPVDILSKGSSITLEIARGEILEQTNYPLSIQVEPGVRLRIQLMYDEERFDGVAITRVLMHWHNVLEEFVTHPRRRLAELSYLSDEEWKFLSEGWKATDVPYPQGCRVHTLFEEQVLHTPEAIAAIYEQEQLTYHELDSRANQLARFLQKLHVAPEVRVGLYLNRSLNMLIGLLGVLKAGGAYVPLDPGYPAERLAYMLIDSQPALVLTQSSLLDTLSMFLPPSTQVLVLDQEQESWGQESISEVASAVHEDHLAYLIYTSGSTGLPKGTMITHRSVCNNLYWRKADYPLSQQDCLLQKTSLSFDPSVWEVFWPLASGARLLLARSEGEKDISYLLSLMQKEAVSVINFSPSMLRIIIEEAAWTQCTNLRIVICGGEALPFDVQKRFREQSYPHAQLFNLYGPTETTIDATIFPCGHDKGGERNAIVPIGRPIPNAQIFIVDKHGAPVPVDVGGEVYIGGVGLARGYFQRPELTAEKFVPHPFSRKPGARLYRTGDLACYRVDGTVEFLGRLDHQVKIRGFRIELGEIESVLRQHPMVDDVVVILKEVSLNNKRLVAYIVHDGSEVAIEEDMSAPGLSDEHVEHWQLVFEQSYEKSMPATPQALFDGWNSSYTGKPVPLIEMQEWLDSTVERILNVHPQNVLEIGCGSGLILLRVAPHCMTYYGTDFSAAALRTLQQNILQQEELLHRVVLRQSPADDFTEIEAYTFDTVIINSVVQYFPHIHYLINVIIGALQAVIPGGCIFIGDVRSLPLLTAYHASVALYQAAPALSLEQLQQRIQTRLAQENELLIDPTFFYALQQQFPQISAVTVSPRRGCYHNELTRFRYDVVLHISANIPATSAGMLSWQDWRSSRCSLTAIKQLLVENEPDYLAISYVANRRLDTENRVLEYLRTEDRPATVGDLRYALQTSSTFEGIDPEDVWDLSKEVPYTVEISWSGAREDGSYDILFRRRMAEEDTAVAINCWPVQEIDNARSWEFYANNPLRDRLARKLIPNVRAHLQNRLPGYMIPTNFVLLEEIPYTLSGKVDHKALPLPGNVLRSVIASPYISPQTEMERTLATIWQEVLQMDEVGIHDNFFDLGGHSLLMVQLYSKLREMVSKEVSMVDLFRHPTVHDLAQYLSQSQPEEVPVQQSRERAESRREALMQQRQHRQRQRTSRTTK